VAPVFTCERLRSSFGGAAAGFVVPTLRVTVKTPICPPHATVPGEADALVVEQVTPPVQLAIPLKTTTPVESIVTIFPAASESNKVGGVAAFRVDRPLNSSTTISTIQRLCFMVRMFIGSSRSFGGK
jgi:hypothetical protein